LFPEPHPAEQVVFNEELVVQRCTYVQQDQQQKQFPA
jgi:hypothetical protein